MRRLVITIAALMLPTALGTLPAQASAETPSAAAPAVGAPAEAPTYVPGEVVVKFDHQNVGRALQLPEGLGVGTATAALRRNPNVDYAVPNYVATASAFLPDDPGTAPGVHGPPGGWTRRQWNFLPCGSLCDPQVAPADAESRGGIDALGAWRNLRKVGRGGAAGVRIAVLDTGIAYRSYRSGKTRFRRSPDFARKQFAGGHDFIKNDAIALDENGHGTHIAGTIGERTNNGLGLTGLAYKAKLIPVRVLNDLGRGQSDDIARGIRFAADHHADVINMSFNFSCHAKVKPVRAALRYAHGKGAVLVASVGNRGSERCVSPPATLPKVIGVAGTTEGACLGSYSLTGEDIDLAAPGGGGQLPSCTARASRPIFQVTLRGGNPLSFGVPRSYVGTSMAAAHVSGVAAMVLASGILGPDPAPSEVARRLKATVRDLGPTGWDPGFGAGLIDAAAATDPETQPG
jgi:serine protease